MGTISSTPAWGFQLPVQSQSSIFVQRWEPDAGTAELLSVAKAADAAGVGYLAVCDHVAIPTESADAMGATWFDPIATLGALAVATTNARLLSHVWVAAYRHPAVTAKAFATLDVLSGGRVILGVGAGHVAAEFDLLGVSFEARGPATDAAVSAVRDIWRRDGEVSGPGGLLVSAPVPIQPGGPPIWIGGSSKPARRRAVQLGDGWLPQGTPEGGMKRAIAELREAVEQRESSRPFEIGIHAGIFGDPGASAGEVPVVTDPDVAIAQCRGCLASGATQLQVRFISDSAQHLCEQLERFGTEWWPQIVS
jgi:probable F420-dependent oxidoreductase